MKVPIGGPFQITEEMKHNINRVLDSGRLSPGPVVKEFEEAFSAYHHTANAIMTNSGTSALIAAIQTLKEIEGWKDGDEIICPALTFVATINAVLHCNLKPVLVDVEPAYYTINPDIIENAITDRTRAIMPVHAFGLTADMDAIFALAANYNINIIEDACESLGATHNGDLAGSIGDIGCFSFYMSHHITAGVGGMAITNNPQYANKMRSLVNHGWDRKEQPLFRDEAADFDFETIKQRYYFTSIGYNFRATELEAAIALPQLQHLDKNVRQRVENAKVLTRRLRPFSDRLQLPKCPYSHSHSLMMYPIVLRNGNKWDLIKHLEKNDIETREMLPLINQPCYKGLFNEDDYPAAKWINELGFYVGCSQYLNENHMNYVADKIGEFLK
jgi:perosamine synthetase